MIVAEFPWLCYKKSSTVEERAMLMTTNSGIFSAKLHELERQYGQTVSRLRLYPQAEHEEVCRELNRLWQEFRENELLMQKNVAGCHSPAVAALAAAQLEYDLSVEHILKDELPGYLHSEGNDRSEDQAEAASLYAEYAIDFAAQSLRHALLAVLSAIDLEMSCEEKAKLRNRTEENANE